MNNLSKRILKLSKKHDLAHIGSCLSVVDILDVIYQMKGENDKVILSQGHVAVALYCVLEKYEKVNAEDLFKKHGVHPNRDRYIDCSTGSLGHGIGIGVGMAIANPDITIFCVVSDGEMAEGSCWEALRIASEHKLTNLKVVGNFNGYSAYDAVNIDVLIHRITAFGWGVLPISGHSQLKIMEGLTLKKNGVPIFLACRTNSSPLPWLKGIDAHYCKVPEDYETS